MTDDEKRLMPQNLLPANFDVSIDTDLVRQKASKLRSPNLPLSKLYEESDNERFLKALFTPRDTKYKVPKQFNTIKP